MNVIPEPNTGCKIWLGATAKGRPKVKAGGKMKYVSRIVCEKAHGPPPSDRHQACHKRHCNNPMCVEETHLYWGTPSQNMLDVPEATRKSSSAAANRAITPKMRSAIGVKRNDRKYGRVG